MQIDKLADNKGWQALIRSSDTDYPYKLVWGRYKLIVIMKAILGLGRLYNPVWKGTKRC